MQPEAPGTLEASRWRLALAGVLAAFAGIATGELIAGFVFSVPSPLVGIADLIIESSPEALQKWAIRTFGTTDKAVLIASILVVAILAGIAIGRRARTSSRVGLAVIWAFTALAFLGLLRSPGVSLTLAILTAIASGGVAAFVFSRLVAVAREAGWQGATPPATVDRSRRQFLAGAGAVVLLGTAATSVGRWLAERARIIASSRSDVVLPRPAITLPPVPADAIVPIEGVSPLLTPNGVFYRIDTAISIPMVNLSDWSVSFIGAVDRPFSLTYDDILGMDLEEHDVTIACVSNEVGGDLIGTARWLGVPLPGLLERAGIRPEGTQIVGRSVDGFTVGFPTQVAMDGRTALLAVGMNGEPLPFEHGFPARLVVSGLYGYVSATKWLSEVELVPWDAFDAYWIPRGWSKIAPIKTQSRIDTPRSGSTVAAGPVPIGGVAWAQNTGITKVEVQVDDGEWHEAQLGLDLSIDTWRQWTYVWDGTDAPGIHIIRVRATDANGNTQTAQEAPPRPDGATGYHSIAVQLL